MNRATDREFLSIKASQSSSRVLTLRIGRDSQAENRRCSHSGGGGQSPSEASKATLLEVDLVELIDFGDFGGDASLTGLNSHTPSKTDSNLDRRPQAAAPLGSQPESIPDSHDS